MAPLLKTVSIRVPDDLADDFQRYAEKTERTASESVEESLKLYLSTYRPNERDAEE